MIELVLSWEVSYLVMEPSWGVLAVKTNTLTSPSEVNLSSVTVCSLDFYLDGDYDALDASLDFNL